MVRMRSTPAASAGKAAPARRRRARSGSGDRAATTSRAEITPPLDSITWDGTPGRSRRVEARADSLDVAGDPALGEGVDESRHRALVLAVLRQTSRKRRRAPPGCCEGAPRAPLLVRRVGVTVDEAHAVRRDALPPDERATSAAPPREAPEDLAA